LRGRTNVHARTHTVLRVVTEFTAPACSSQEKQKTKEQEMIARLRQELSDLQAAVSNLKLENYELRISHSQSLVSLTGLYLSSSILPLPFPPFFAKRLCSCTCGYSLRGANVCDEAKILRG